MTIKTIRSFPLIDIAGPPEQRGLEYGTKAKTHIHRAIQNYKLAYADLGVGWDHACGIANSFLPMLEGREERLLSEIKAIARGAGVQTSEVLALNCRTEIMYGSGAAGDMPTDGCTGVIALPEATASGNVIHAQNWDWRAECAETSIVLRITPESGPQIITQTEAGNLARCGMNDRGITLTGNFLKCERDNQPGGIPIPFVRRHILEQEALSEALGVAFKAPKSFSTNLMVTDGREEGFNLETVPGETFWINPQDGLLVHANHFESPGALAKLQDLGLRVAPCSLYRSRRAKAYLRKWSGRITIDHIKTILSDRYGSPSAICAAPDQGPGGDMSATVATIIMDVADRRMWVAPLPFLAHEYTCYEFAA